MSEIKTVRNIPDDVWKEAHEAAKRQGKWFGAWLTEAIREKLNKKRGK